MGGRGITTIEEAMALFTGYLPQYAVLTIEETDGKLVAKYIFRVHYTSTKSRRTMCVLAKGDRLPIDHGKLFDFYLRQLLLTQQELAKEFSHLRFLEQRARQNEFLFGGKNVRVAQTLGAKDKIEDESLYRRSNVPV